ncbi:hypothetical protein [Sphingobacterium alkalisoli]|uniref:hypothetical protein n=1 Tax=Sphingobacterium alkalisoli TaxID=1874115 RepID=UPI001668DC37|nr:hypothetical protein [Sphingobacterium alkalisoli]
MKKEFVFVVLMIAFVSSFAQTETVIAPSNRSAVSLEKNMLFYANNRFSVTQSGSISLSTPPLFDANFYPSYSSTGIDEQNPYVLLIENLPNEHVQRGGWIGWTSRYYSPVKFKIEVYNTYLGANEWVTMVDVNNYTASHFIAKTPDAMVGKIRLTVYKTNDAQNRLGLSEVFFLHPEAVKSYDGLMVQYNAQGNVGIGANATSDKLAVNGNIRAKEIKVETANWPDYVFSEEYELMPLSAIEQYIRGNGHLPEIPKATQVEKDGLSLGEMNKLLLKKIEELTLHLIEKEKQINEQQKKIDDIFILLKNNNIEL